MQPARILYGARVEVAEYPGVRGEPPQPAEETEPLPLAVFVMALGW